MSYIKIRIPERTVVEDGRMHRATIHRLRSDLPGAQTMELMLIMHTLSAPGWRQEETQGAFILDTSTLDSERWLLG